MNTFMTAEEIVNKYHLDKDMDCIIMACAERHIVEGKPLYMYNEKEAINYLIYHIKAEIYRYTKMLDTLTEAIETFYKEGEE